MRAMKSWWIMRSPERGAEDDMFDGGMSRWSDSRWRRIQSVASGGRGGGEGVARARFDGEVWLKLETRRGGALAKLAEKVGRGWDRWPPTPEPHAARGRRNGRAALLKVAILWSKRAIDFLD